MNGDRPPVAGPAAPRELVLASAGSGKTYHISSRIIGLLAYGEAPEHLLASTFTRKAAGQILDRVLSRLADAALEPRMAVELAAAATLDPARPLPGEPAFWAALLERVAGRLHRFHVGTLDAFFIRAAGAFEYELGLPPAWRIPDAPALARLRSRALLEVLDTLERRKTIELLRLLARGDARRSVHDRLFMMIGQLLEVEEELDPDAGDPWRAFEPAAREPEPDPAERTRLAEAIRTLRLPASKAGAPLQTWVKALEDARAAVLDADWERFASLTLCQRVARGEMEYGRAEIPFEVRDLIEELLDAARAALRPRLAEQVRALGAITRLYRASYRRLQRKQGLFDFADVTRLIGGGDPLGSRADLYYRMDARTRHVLLDEFQDTSLAQWEALAPLVDEVLSDDGRAAVIVADPKQSIYGWRGAEPRIVHRVGERYGLANTHLSKSWRSSEVVLGFVNRIFERIGENPILAGDDLCTAAANEWAGDFRPHAAQRHLPGYAAIEVGPRDGSHGGDRPLLCRHAARRVADLLRDHPGFSIGVLTRTNATVARLFVELRDLDVPVSQEGGNPLTDSAPCEAVLALLRLADHPGDSIARYHVANSPLGAVLGFGDHLDSDGSRRLARRLRRRLVEDGYGATVSDLARRIAPACDRREARRLGLLTELAYRYDADASLRPTDFVRLAEAERAEDRATADVRVMTVHQAKGLEFDIVVLPELDDPIFRGGRPAPVLTWRQDPGGRVTAVYPHGSEALRCLFPELQGAYDQRREAILRDGLSTLYVGLTRARHAVHAMIAADGDAGPGRALTPSRILREALRDEAASLPPAVEGSTLFSVGDPAWHRRKGAEGEASAPIGEGAPLAEVRFRAGSRSRLLQRTTPSKLASATVTNVGEILRLSGSGAAERGLIAHAWLEGIGWIEDGAPDESTLRRIARRVAPGLGEEQLRLLLEEFRGWLGAAPIRRVLSRTSFPEGAVVECEVPFFHRSGDLLVEGVIDRLVTVYEGGRPVRAEVFDFKSDRPPEHPDGAAHLVERYRPQLNAYAAAVADMLNLDPADVSASLVFLETGAVGRLASEAENLPRPGPGD